MIIIAGFAKILKKKILFWSGNDRPNLMNFPFLMWSSMYSMVLYTDITIDIKVQTEIRKTLMIFLDSKEQDPQEYKLEIENYP